MSPAVDMSQGVTVACKCFALARTAMPNKFLIGLACKTVVNWVICVCDSQQMIHTCVEHDKWPHPGFQSRFTSHTNTSKNHCPRAVNIKTKLSEKAASFI